MEDLLAPAITLTEFASAWAAHERDAARLAHAAVSIELSGSWGADGSVSMASWLRSECGMSSREAMSLLHRGRFLQRHEVVGHAALDGTLTGGQVTAIRSAVSPSTESVFAEQQEALVPVLAPLSVAETRTAMQVWRARAEAIVDAQEPHEPERSLSWCRTADGGGIGRFVFDALLAEQFDRALRTAQVWEGTADRRSHQQRRADALLDVCAHFNANHERAGTPRHRPHVELTVDASDLEHPVGVTTDGSVMPVSSTQTLLCDSVLHRVVTAGSTVLDYGRSVRSVPRHLFRAVALRDGGCRFPGCDRPVAWCDAHHTPAWTQNGETRIDLLVLLCARHHHRIHQQQVEIKILPDARVEFTWPDGGHLGTRPHHRARPPDIPG